MARRRLSDGRTETVAGGFGGAFRPIPSPDGNRVAFVRRVKAKTVLFVLDLRTGEQTPVYDGLDRDGTAVFESQGNYYPRFSWFPDSRDIAVWAGGHIMRVDTETGAHAVIPFEVESVLATHPLVRECAVIAVPDDIRGEVLEAFVVLRSDAKSSTEIVQDLQQWVKVGYAAHAYPRNIHFAESLPKTPSGKVQRFVLRQKRRDELAAMKCDADPQS